ncbi:acetyl-CoA carboxylase biotin carboxyl carrier protein [Pelobacter seleniigenes]|uniref:acetyl-CoA carboxylase biotin carboxyl carrier protein n=1 Tax=Pelobacter seleniigenes TaxID=407188 RepID=UPI0004A741DF|nr:acetyl-CoA carboxylase biotin carboxyl carrier protein [Pelobacter seleniigenes]
MELKDLKGLIKLITETDITEFDLENDEEKIHIKRGSEKEIIQMTAPAAVVQPAPVVAASAPAAVAPTTVDSAPQQSKYDAIPSPIVGSFYRKPSPDAEPFCKVGDIVDAGQVLCLVEAMKLFNEIEAEFKCKIIEVVKEDGAPVEYGETLFLVEKL